MKILSNELYRAMKDAVEADQKLIQSQSRMIEIQDKIIKNGDVIIAMLKDKIKLSERGENA